MKSEPDCFSIDNLMQAKNQTSPWDGVRNYQARNFMRDEMQPNDLAFFYHSSCKEVGIAGIIEIVKAAYPDFTAWDPKNEHYDPKSPAAKPLWYMVDVRCKKKFDDIIPLQHLRDNPLLKNMFILRKGNRLSITPLTKQEWGAILKMTK
jgi:predicted RNA-binding protein with PUA-like domain